MSDVAEVSNDVPLALPDATRLGAAAQGMLSIEEKEEAIGTCFKAPLALLQRPL